MPILDFMLKNKRNLISTIMVLFEERWEIRNEEFVIDTKTWVQVDSSRYLFIHLNLIEISNEISF